MANTSQVASGEFAVPDHGGEFYTGILDRIHSVLKPKTYFEIGTLHGSTLALSKCPSVAVDPSFQLNCDVLGTKPACLLFQETSDDFFLNHNVTELLGEKVDFAFLDGLHFYEYLLRDFMNIEKYCQKNSIIGLHDCVPTDLFMARRDPASVSAWSSPPHPEWWAGDVWKVLVILKQYRPDLEIYVFDASPTGLVLITNLDPTNEFLKRNGEQIVAEFSDLRLSSYGLRRFHAEIEVRPTSLIGNVEAISKVFSRCVWSGATTANHA